MFSVGQQLIPKYTFNRNTGTRTQKTGTRILRPVFFYNIKKLDTTQMFFYSKMGQQILAYSGN